MNIIETNNIGKKYIVGETENQVLKNVTLNIRDGEFIAIMGPSGSGKSTLLHILGFLDRQTTGTYQFEGKDTDSYTKGKMAQMRNKKMGFIFQTFNLLPRMTVTKNVELPLIYSGINRNRWKGIVKKAIDQVGLSERAHHMTNQLSGGEQQRVAIARALINDPKIILADEPTGNLDSKSGEIVMETINKLNKEQGRTVILVTHETYTARYAERIIELKDGSIVKNEKVSHRNGSRKFRK